MSQLVAGGGYFLYLDDRVNCSNWSVVTYEAWMMTPTPAGATASVSATAICLVSLSCTANKEGQAIRSSILFDARIGKFL